MPEWVVPAEEAGKKLITFLTERLGPSISARSLKKALESNCCTINQRTERFASVPLAKGDHIVLKLSIDQSKSIIQFEQRRILFEDSSFFIYNKPAGVNCDENGILKILKKHNPSLLLIHRLDRDTTGVLLLAKNQMIYEKMVLEFKQFHVDKSYLAIVDGVIEKKEGIVDNYLGKKHVYAGQTIWGAVSSKVGLHAFTQWIRMKIGKNATLVGCYPKTGRTHQLRVHLNGIGHPILGDFQYCKHFKCHYQPGRYLLHAYEITFSHPLTKEVIIVKAPLPNDFKEASKELFQS